MTCGAGTGVYSGARSPAVWSKLSGLKSLPRRQLRSLVRPRAHDLTFRVDEYLGRLRSTRPGCGNIPRLLVGPISQPFARGVRAALNDLTPETFPDPIGERSGKLK